MLKINCLRFEANVGFIHNIMEIKLMINSSWAIMLDMNYATIQNHF